MYFVLYREGDEKKKIESYRKDKGVIFNFIWGGWVEGDIYIVF